MMTSPLAMVWNQEKYSITQYVYSVYGFRCTCRMRGAATAAPIPTPMPPWTFSNEAPPAALAFSSRAPYVSFVCSRMVYSVASCPEPGPGPGAMGTVTSIFCVSSSSGPLSNICSTDKCSPICTRYTHFFGRRVL